MILFKIAQKVNNIFVSKFVAKKFQKSGHTTDVSTTKLFQIFAKNEIFLEEFNENINISHKKIDEEYIA